MVASNTNAYLDASSLAQEVALEKIKASIHDFLKKVLKSQERLQT